MRKLRKEHKKLDKSIFINVIKEETYKNPVPNNIQNPTPQGQQRLDDEQAKILAESIHQAQLTQDEIDRQQAIMDEATRQTLALEQKQKQRT